MPKLGIKEHEIVKISKKKLLALRNNFRVTKKFLIAKFDCTKNSEFSEEAGKN